jgi:hypothetical protein
MAKAKETKKAMSAEEKAAKKKARLEAIKNRPAGQRCNSKQVDVIETENGTVETWGYPVVAARKHIGVLTTTIVKDKGGNVISTASTWVPGDLTIKAKKGHGIITGVKSKKEKEKEEDTDTEKDEAEEAPKAKKSKKND